ncbi:MAG: NUDIX hydrolase [Magnetococcales bacterium]|nr:NUDIX hydrolase [Magnetococcales bacterium]NGZ05116.1 NUDIX hydrolase [Magnetococcales bacterium]
MSPYPDYYYRQSAVIPVRGSGVELQVLMISSRTGQRWVIPKGIVEPNLTPAVSAAKEALEEAGIEGVVFSDSIGMFEYEKWGGTCVAEVFVMRVEKVRDQWLENTRERVWLSLEEAVNRTREGQLQKLMLQVPGFLARMES